MTSENQRIGSYELLRELARGSFGRVYLAQHVVLTNRLVAIKLMLSAPLASAGKQESFLQEARFLEVLKHPHILPIIDVSFHEDIPYLVTEYASSGSLRDLLNQRSPHLLPLEESLRILVQIGQALHYAHQQQIIHRDLKPENIVFNAHGDALLTDFGISTMLTTASIKNVDNDGTPAYMAPEQFRGTISRESDQYALGCIAYELVTGHAPFTAPDFFSLGFKHLMEPPLAPTVYTPQLPEHIAHAILKALAKERTNRYPDIWAFITALQAPPLPQEAIPTLLSTSHQAAAPLSSPGIAPTTPVPLDPYAQQDGKQLDATILPSDIRSHPATLAQIPPSGRVEHHVTDPGKPEALAAFGQNNSSIPPWSQGPVTPFPPAVQDMEPASLQGERAGEQSRRRTVVILIAASLVLLISLGSVLFFVLPSVSSMQPFSSLSQNPIQTHISNPTTPTTTTQKKQHTSASGSQHLAATSTPHTIPTATTAPNPTSTIAPNPTPTVPTPTAPAVSTPTPTPPPTTETFMVPFTDGIAGVSTQHSYSGTVQVTVSGTGQTASTKWSDAFYIYTDSSGNPLNPPFHASCWVMTINGQSTNAFVSTPAYQGSHSYTFTMTAPGGPLSFGVCDGVPTDNTGSYTVTVTQE
jgi:serine/threonine protein kinase